MAGRKSNEQKLKELNEAILRAVDHMLDDIGDDLEIAYGRCIDRFYKDYPHPKFYDRTFSLYAGSDGWDNPHRNKKKISDTKYYIGINVGWENILMNLGEDPYLDRGPYRDNVKFVFERAYLSGIHGMTLEEASNRGLKWHHLPMTPPPIHFMEKEYRKIANKSYLDKLWEESILRELSHKK